MLSSGRLREIKYKQKVQKDLSSKTGWGHLREVHVVAY